MSKTCTMASSKDDQDSLLNSWAIRKKERGRARAECTCLPGYIWTRSKLPIDFQDCKESNVEYPIDWKLRSTCISCPCITTRHCTLLYIDWKFVETSVNFDMECVGSHDIDVEGHEMWARSVRLSIPCMLIGVHSRTWQTADNLMYMGHVLIGALERRNLLEEGVLYQEHMCII